MDALFRELVRFAQTGEPVAVATVIDARGSTPRQTGASMIVRADGSMAGSVGGGCGEAQVFWEAARVLEGGAPRLCEVDLTGEIHDLSQTNCGGIMTVFVECLRWVPEVPVGLTDAGAVGALAEVGRAGHPRVLLVVVSSAGGQLGIPTGTKWVADGASKLIGHVPAGLGTALEDVARSAWASGRSGCMWLEESAGRWVAGPAGAGLGIFVGVVTPMPELIVVGAGHIAVPLAQMAKLLDFEVTVLDDRAAFASRERFPTADTILVGDIERILRERSVGPWTYLVLVTRGHQHDEAALKAVITSDAAYLGMIGSRRRVREVFRHLEAEGIGDEAIGRVHAPIGLDIGAETPAEIAAAIVAELVAVRRGRSRRRPAPHVAA